DVGTEHRIAPSQSHCNMSALPPIATRLVRRIERSRSARGDIRADPSPASIEPPLSVIYFQLDIEWRVRASSVRFSKPGRNTMNRRSVFSLSAITLLGLTLVPGTALPQQNSLKEQLIGTWPTSPQQLGCGTGARCGGQIPKASLSSQTTVTFPGKSFARIVQNLRRMIAYMLRRTNTQPRCREASPISVHTRSTRRTKP